MTTIMTGFGIRLLSAAFNPHSTTQILAKASEDLQTTNLNRSYCKQWRACDSHHLHHEMKTAIGRFFISSGMAGNWTHVMGEIRILGLSQRSTSADPCDYGAKAELLKALCKGCPRVNAEACRAAAADCHLHQIKTAHWYNVSSLLYVLKSMGFSEWPSFDRQFFKHIFAFFAKIRDSNGIRVGGNISGYDLKFQIWFHKKKQPVRTACLSKS